MFKADKDRDLFDWHLRSKDFLSAVRLRINARSDNLVHYFFNQSTSIMENIYLFAIIVGLRKYFLFSTSSSLKVKQLQETVYILFILIFTLTRTRSANNDSSIWSFNIETAPLNYRITSFNWLTSSDVPLSLQAMAIFSEC